MAKNFHYFKFIPTEWMTGDIVFEDLELQGLFINVCALYWQRNGELTTEDLYKRFKNRPLIDRLADNFIVVNDGLISVKFLDEQLVEANHISKVNSNNGKLGGRPKTLEKKPTALDSISEKKPNKIELKENRIKLNNKKSKQKKDVFLQPTQNDVVLYFQENGFSESLALKAFRYYDTAEWHDNNGKKIRNWKQKMQGVWFKEENKEKKDFTAQKKESVNGMQYKPKTENGLF